MRSKLCVDCRAYIPVTEFRKAHIDFPTRDGLNHCCMKHEHLRPRYVRVGKKVELWQGESGGQDGSESVGKSI